MKLSALQKYILKQVYLFKTDRFNRKNLLKFYNQRKVVKNKDRVNIITKSLERLIDKELLTGFGVRTPHKWFIKEIKLTAKGRQIAKSLFGKQQVLPLKLIKRKAKKIKQRNNKSTE